MRSIYNNRFRFNNPLLNPNSYRITKKKIKKIRIFKTQFNEYCKRNHILKTPQEIARIYSKEIEYSQENMEIIFEELLFG